MNILDINIPDINILDINILDINILDINILDINILDINILDINILDINIWDINIWDINIWDRDFVAKNQRCVPTPWYQNPSDASPFLHARPNFREKWKKKHSIFRPKFDLRVLSSQNIKMHSKIFSYDQKTSYDID